MASSNLRRTRSLIAGSKPGVGIGFLLGILILVNISAGYSQVVIAHAVFSPEKPIPGQTIKVVYQPPGGLVINGEITCLAYQVGTPSPTNARGFPIVNEIKLSLKEGHWDGEIETLTSSLGLVAVFADEAGTMDNSDGIGYPVPFYSGSEILAGYPAAKATLYTELISNPSYIRQNKKLARSLFEDEFRRHPEVKRNYLSYYLSTLDLLLPADSVVFKEELNSFAQSPELTENELQWIWRFYSSCHKQDLANSYKEQAFSHFPNGVWRVTTASLELGIQIATTKDWKKRTEIYNQYKKLFDHSYEDEWAQARMDDRKGDFLSYLVELYIKGDSLKAWESEVGTLNDCARCHTYQRTANQLSAHSQSEVATSSDPRIAASGKEHPFFTFKIGNNSDRVQLAEKLSRQAITLFRANLNSPRRIQESLYLTDKQVADWRARILASYLDQLGLNLLAQNKFDEAYKFLKEAVELTHYSNQDANEHLIETLIKTDRLDSAKEECRRMIRLSKSTHRIDECYLRLNGDQATVVGRRMASIGELKQKLKSELIEIKAPTLDLIDAQGNPISSKSLKGKAIVIDFWALWCAPCIKSLGAITHVAQTYGRNNNVAFLFVNVKGDAHDRASELLKQKGGNLQFALDRDNTLLTDYGISGIPTLVIIDRHGNVRFKRTGIYMEMSDQEKENELIAMLELVND